MILVVSQKQRGIGLLLVSHALIRIHDGPINDIYVFMSRYPVHICFNKCREQLPVL